jgi:hypothetical protein
MAEDARADPRVPSPLPAANVETAYVLEQEALYELSNDTIHALIHLAVTGNGSATLAVYVKSRGLFSRAYMAAIGPFRHLVVYPSLVRLVERNARLRR